MKINLDIQNLIKRLLPEHMIQKNRISVYWWILREIDYVWKEYKNFRDYKLIEKNITYSLQSFEWWLNLAVFGDGDAGKLSIIVGSGNPYYMVLEEGYSGEDYVLLSSESDGTDSIELARESDNFGVTDVDFAIESEISLSASQKEEINLIVEQFRCASMKYKIIE